MYLSTGYYLFLLIKSFRNASHSLLKKLCMGDLTLKRALLGLQKIFMPLLCKCIFTIKIRELMSHSVCIVVVNEMKESTDGIQKTGLPR